MNGLVWEPMDSLGGTGRGLRGSRTGFRVADHSYIMIVTFFLVRLNILPTRTFARHRLIVHNTMLIPIARKSETTSPLWYLRVLTSVKPFNINDHDCRKKMYRCVRHVWLYTWWSRMLFYYISLIPILCFVINCNTLYYSVLSGGRWVRLFRSIKINSITAIT